MRKLSLELLAPAGSRETLEAALANGADAVYFGLQTLNARHGAKNFTLEELADTVRFIHANNVRAFLTLNIDFTAREISQVAKVLTAAREAEVDAILFTDPAMLILKNYFPEIEFHFSTQASVTTSAGVRAAQDLGVKRVVLAREMSGEEISKAAAVTDVEVEVFTQGALCFCVSGRCLLSSWGGGRSGNRGSCTSPCRVSWKITGNDKEDVLSLQDLSLIEKLPELAEAGVASLKIEGRLKNAVWVAKAVSLYREVIDGITSHSKDDTLPLGEYTGRTMTDGYYSGQRRTVFGSSGRVARENTELRNTASAVKEQENPADNTVESYNCSSVYDFTVITSGKQLECEVEYEGVKTSWNLPKTVIKHEKRGLTVGDAAGWLEKLTIQDAVLNKFMTDDAEFLISKKATNKIADNISSALHRTRKSLQKNEKKEIPLTGEIKNAIKLTERSERNILSLKDKPNAVRLHMSQVQEVLPEISVKKVIVEHADLQSLDLLQELTAKSQLVIALPAVFFEDKVKQINDLCQECGRRGIAVEVNGWDGWKIARETEVKFEGGPGIAVLNPLAAQALLNSGFSAVTYSLEAGEKQYTDLSVNCPAEATVVIFSRPVLAYTRAEMPEKLEQHTVLRDARGISVRIDTYGDVTELRSTKAYAISGIDNPAITACWLCADLINSPKPVNEWKNLPRKKNKETFNFERGLF